MTIIVTGYDSKKDLKAAVGEKLQFVAYGLDKAPSPNIKDLLVANRPHVTGRGREFFALVDLVDGKIARVK